MTYFEQENFQRLLELGKLACLAEELEEEEEEEDEENRRIWVRDWIAKRKDDMPLFKEIATEDRDKFFTDFRLFPEHFEDLLSR
jgi:hypothetical protein